MIDQLATALGQREKRRRLHNRPGFGDDPAWRRNIFAPSQLDISRRELAARHAIKPTPDVLKTLGDSRVNFPASCSSWKRRLHHVTALRNAKFDIDDPRSDIIAAEWAKLKQHPDKEYLDKPLPSIRTDAPEIPDPPEDFRAPPDGDFLTIDDESRLTVIANKVTFTALERNDRTRVYSDKGAGHFGDFVHLWESCITVNAGGWMCPWVVGNTDPTTAGLYGRYQWWGTPVQNAGYVLRGHSHHYIMDYEQTAYDSWTSGVLGTLYFHTTTRAATVLQNEVRTGSHSGTLKDTLTTTAVSGRTWRYIWAVNEDGYNTTDNLSGYVQNLDLQEAVTTDWYYRAQERVVA